MFAINRLRRRHPGRAKVQPVTLDIDGAEVTVPAGTSVMRAAAARRTPIPKLCATDTLKAFGSCRVCLVEIEGRKGYPASCTTLVAPGHEGAHATARSCEQLRRGVSSSMSPTTRSIARAARPMRTASCKAMAQRRRCHDEPATASTAHNHFDAAADDEQSLFPVRPDACIACSRCVRACDEMQGTFALTIEGRGFDSRVVGEPGRAVPRVGVRLVRRLRRGLSHRRAQRKVAADRWAGRSRRSRRPAPTAASAVRSRPRCKGEQVVRMVPSRDGKANHGHACVKGRFAYGYATHADRITTADDPRARSPIPGAK